MSRDAGMCRDEQSRDVQGCRDVQGYRDMQAHSHSPRAGLAVPGEQTQLSRLSCSQAGAWVMCCGIIPSPAAPAVIYLPLAASVSRGNFWSAEKAPSAAAELVPWCRALVQQGQQCWGWQGLSQQSSAAPVPSQTRGAPSSAGDPFHMVLPVQQVQAGPGASPAAPVPLRVLSSAPPCSDPVPSAALPQKKKALCAFLIEFRSIHCKRGHVHACN